MPIGSEIDARKGQLEIKTASKFDKRGQRQGLQQGRFAAGIFAIRQAAKRQAGAAKAPTTDLVLQSPPGSARACAASSTVRPIKGVVRTLSATAKGNFRTIGGASTTTATDGSWIVSDRCNGTLTEVGRGKVTVHDTKLRQGLHRALRAGLPRPRAAVRRAHDRRQVLLGGPRHLLQARRAVHVAAEVLGRADRELLGPDHGDERAQPLRDPLQRDPLRRRH